MRYDQKIPADWQCEYIGSLLSDIGAGTSVNGYDYPATDGERGVLKLGAVAVGGGFKPSENKEIKPEELVRAGPSVKKGTLLLSRSNTIDLVGACSAIRENYPNLHVPDLLWIVTPHSECDPLWLQYLIAARPVRRGIRAIATGTSGSMMKLSMKAFRKIEVPIPPLTEQRKIAAILSTWDRAIELTEKLIAAKKKRKQALMQQLLTGNVRLPGLNEDWTVRKAGDLFGTRSVKKYPDEPVLSVTQDQGVVRRDELDRKISMNETTTGTYKLVEPEDFVISLRSFQGGLEMSRIRGIVSPAYHVIRPKVKLDSEFFRHFFKSAEFIGRLAVAIIGIRDGKQIAFGDFSFLNFRFPPIQEQVEIGRVLTLADNEIELLRKKLASLQSQKRGLMQKLLTGKVRVNTNAETVKG